MLKAGDFLTPEEIVYVKWVMELWNGKVTRVTERKHGEEKRENKINRPVQSPDKRAKI